MPSTPPLLGNESARAQLRQTLAQYLHQLGPAAPGGYHAWTAPGLAAPPAPALLVGDPIALSVSPSLSPHLARPDLCLLCQENLKILRQYTKLLLQACHDRNHPVAHAQPLSNSPAACQDALQWFAHLAQPCRGLDGAASARIAQLLQLHAACQPPLAQTPQEQAYALALSLPHYDRDLTAFYLQPDHLPRMEYELDVAHSILRLHAPATLDDLRARLPVWRSQGLLHVLSLAAAHMPEPADWPASDTSLAHCLEALQRAPREHAKTIESFIVTQDLATPAGLAVADTLDRLAILMDVKSDAAEGDHDLARALAAFPRLIDAPADAWCSLKPALEKALPPSVLRLDPAWTRKRAKPGTTTAKGTWYSPRPLVSRAC